MAQSLRPGHGAQVVFPRDSTRHEIEVIYSGDLDPCLEFVKRVGDGYGFSVDLHVAHEADGDAARVTLRSATSGQFAETLENLSGIQEFAVELGLYVE